MSPSDLTPCRSNPFSSRFVRPGALAFVCPPGITLTGMVERFVALGERAQIVGPHGAGKSTLLAALRHALQARGRDVVTWELHAGEGPRFWPWLPTRPQAGSVWLVDGLEQLGFAARVVLQCRLARCGAGILATTHHDLGLSTLVTLAPSVELAAELVGGLCGADPCRPSPDEVCRAYDRAGGNIRETLFDLYAWYEAHSRDQAARATDPSRANSGLTPLGRSTTDGL